MTTANWGEEDVALLRQFFESQTGRSFVAALSDAVPVLLDGGDVNKTLVRSGEVKGWGEALRHAMTLAYPPQPQPAANPERRSAYPPLDLDEAWDANNQPIET